MLGLSQEKLGESLGITFQQIQKYEKGSNRIGASRLQSLSHILKTPISFFFEDAPSSQQETINGMAEADSPNYVVDFLSSSEGLQLNKAFANIKDPKARQNYLFTSESVSEGHPDKVCDRISDEIVDLIYKEAIKTGLDPWSVRIAAETLTTTNRVVIAGEVRLPDTLCKKDKDGNIIKDASGNPVVAPGRFRSAARRAIRDIGYEQDGFHHKTAKIDVLLHAQSADIAQGVDNAADKQGEEGAGDQGIMFGYACTETPDLMPAPIYYSHKILELMAKARKSGEGEAAKLGPDAKSQITIRYEDGKPKEVASIVVSTQHMDESWDSAKVRAVINSSLVAQMAMQV